MEKLINTKYPQNIIIVDDAYVNGSRIVCSAGNDVFDVWESCWKIEDFQPSEDLEKEAVSMTPEQQLARDHETFAEHYGCLPDPPEPTPVIVGAASYESLSDIIAIGFMDYLDRNRTEGKMCLSGWECDDIINAFRKQDWQRIERYRDKYLLSKNDGKD